MRFIRVIAFILVLAVLGLAYVYYFVLAPLEPHPDAPELTLITDQRDADGLALFQRAATVELTPKKEEPLLLQVLEDELYQRRLRADYPLGRMAEGTLLDAHKGRNDIPRAFFERHGEGKYWVRGGMFCGDRAFHALEAMLRVHIAERTGFMLVSESEPNAYKAYCIGEFLPFIWRRGADEAQTEQDLRWVLSGTVLKAGVFEFRLPLGFEPLSIVQTVEETVRKQLEGKKQGLAFKYMFAYESASMRTMLIFYATEFGNKLTLDALKKGAQSRVSQGIERVQLEERSRVVEGLAIDGVKTVLADMFYKDGQGQMKTFDLLYGANNKVKHTVAILQEGAPHLDEQNIPEFLSAIKLKKDY